MARSRRPPAVRALAFARIGAPPAARARPAVRTRDHREAARHAGHPFLSSAAGVQRARESKSAKSKVVAGAARAGTAEAAGAAGPPSAVGRSRYRAALLFELRPPPTRDPPNCPPRPAE